MNILAPKMGVFHMGLEEQMIILRENYDDFYLNSVIFKYHAPKYNPTDCDFSDKLSSTK
jgi:hypothetical protein